MEQLLVLAQQEDLGDRALRFPPGTRQDAASTGDWTTEALVPATAVGRAAIVARRPGVLAGEPAVEPTLWQFDRRLQWSLACRDGQAWRPGKSSAGSKGRHGDC